MNNRETIARKYAKAFLNIYIDDISFDQYKAITKLETFFKNHRKVVFFLSIPNITTEEKEKNLYELLSNFKLAILKPLIRLLINQKRIFLIDDVLTQIIILYKEAKNIMMFNIMTPHQLEESDILIIRRFLADKTEKIITWKYLKDKKLIAGLRLQSNTLLWEYSIYKQCERLRQKFNR